MSSVPGPTTETATRREPILICCDDSPNAVRAIEAAAALLGPRRAVFVDVVPWMTSAESMTNVKKIFDASVSRQVAEHAGRPVLIVPPPH